MWPLRFGDNNPTVYAHIESYRLIAYDYISVNVNICVQILTTNCFICFYVYIYICIYNIDVSYYQPMFPLSRDFTMAEAVPAGLESLAAGALVKMVSFAVISMVKTLGKMVVFHGFNPEKTGGLIGDLC